MHALAVALFGGSTLAAASAGWRVRESPCRWAGVGCDAGARVVSIALPPSSDTYEDGWLSWLAGRKPAGALAPDLGSLTSLRTLALPARGLRGPIHDVFGGMAALENIDLSRNRLEGGVPGSLGAAPRLAALDLSRNSLAGPVPASLATSDTLKRVDLAGNPGLCAPASARALPAARSPLPACGSPAAAAALLHPTIAGLPNAAPPSSPGLNATVSVVGGALLALLVAGAAVQLSRSRAAVAEAARLRAARDAAAAARGARRVAARAGRAAAAWRPPPAPPTLVLSPDGTAVWVAKRDRVGDGLEFCDAGGKPAAGEAGAPGSPPPASLPVHRLHRTETQASEAASPGPASTPVAGAASPALRARLPPGVGDVATLRAALGDVAAADLLSLLARLEADASRRRRRAAGAPRGAPLFSVTLPQPGDDDGPDCELGEGRPPA